MHEHDFSTQPRISAIDGMATDKLMGRFERTLLGLFILAAPVVSFFRVIWLGSF